MKEEFEKLHPNWDWTGDHKQCFMNWVQWLNNDTGGEWDVDQSIILSGGNGCGKTTFLNFFSFVSVHGGFGFDKDKRFTVFETQRIVDDVLINGSVTLVQFYNSHEYYSLGIDEVGSERECRVYGNELYPIEQIMAERFNRKMLFAATTNLDIEDFFEKYGGRLSSRRKDMNWFEIVSEDYRGRKNI